MRITLGRLRAIVQEALGGGMKVGYPFGLEQPPATEPHGSMLPSVDRVVLPIGAGFEEPECVDGLNLNIFQDEEELFLPVAIDPYVRDYIRKPPVS